MTGRAWLVVAPFLLLVVVAACTGGAGEAPYTPESANYPTDVPACQALNGFRAYRYVHSFRWFSPAIENLPANPDLGNPPFSLFPNAPTFEFSQTYEGAIENPAKADIVLKTPNSPDVKMRWVAGQAWNNLGVKWMPAGKKPMQFPPALVCHAVMKGLDLSMSPAQIETVDGQDTMHYQLKQVPLDVAGLLWGHEGDPARLLKNYDVDAWMTNDGWPARLEVKASAKYPSGRDFAAEVSLQVKDINAKDISITAPPSD